MPQSAILKKLSGEALYAEKSVAVMPPLFCRAAVTFGVGVFFESYWHGQLLL